jgi:hypothetical protein
VERGIPGILFHEDLVLLSPYMHTEQDIVGVSLNSDPLFEGNVRAAAVTLFTLARPVQPEPVVLYALKDPMDLQYSVQLQWAAGFPPFDLHRVEGFPQGLPDEANQIAGEMGAREFIDDQAFADRLYYSVEEFP